MGKNWISMSVVTVMNIALALGCREHRALIAPGEQEPEPWTAPRIQIPAEIYWGAYRNMEQLTEPGTNWEFVRENMDGFLLHQAYWLFNTAKQKDPWIVAPKLAERLKGKPAILEITRPHSYGKPWDKNWGSGDGAIYVEKIKQLLSLRASPDLPSLKITEINVDFNMNVYKSIAWRYPDWTKEELLAQATGFRPAGHQGRDFAGYWRDLNTRFFENFPGIQIHGCYPPVYFDWHDFPALVRNNLVENPLKLRLEYISSSEFTTLNNRGVPFDVNTVVVQEGHRIAFQKDGDEVVLTLDGKTVGFQIKGEEAMEALFESLAATGNRMAGFVSDSPYPYMIWKGEGSAEARAHREKLRAYEGWLQSRGAKHSLIVNSEVKAASPAEWDQKYHQDSLKDLRLYQREGGRANRYLLESWYEGPYKIVPEDEPYTFTHLVREAILYLKGTGQRLDLLLRSEDGRKAGEGEYQKEPVSAQSLAIDEGTPVQRFEVLLKNNGDTAALPWLVAQESRLDGFESAYFCNGEDITERIRSKAGYTLPEVLEPGHTQVLSIQLTRIAGPASRAARITMAAFWNPQDSTQEIRDVVTLFAS